jgi:oligo-alginate lyase
LRTDGRASQVFATVIEPHGEWDTVKEQTSGAEPTIHDVRVVAVSEAGAVVKIGGDHGLDWTLLVASDTAVPHHRVVAEHETYEWDGFAVLRRGNSAR